MPNFSKPIGFLLRDYVEFTQEQTEYVLLQQAQNIAVINGLGSWVDTYNALLDGSFKEAIPRDVPLFGNIAVDMKFASSEQRDTLLAAQAAEKTFLASAEKINLLKDGKLNLDDRIVSRPFIGEPGCGGGVDPGYLVRAQAISHVAEILATAKKLYPELTVSSGLHAAMKISDMLFTDVASRFEILGMTKARDAVEVTDGTSLDVYMGHTSNLFSEARYAVNTLKKTNLIDSSEKNQLDEILERRQEQSRLNFRQTSPSELQQGR